jgi:polyhydroxyalkanoate synthesis regulator protein
MQSRDLEFRKQIAKRLEEITKITNLYLLVIQCEQTKQSGRILSQGNLLAQLICYNELMQLLQERNMSISFQNNIKVKYRLMIENINSALENAYKKDLKMAEEDDMHIC